MDFIKGQEKIQRMISFLLERALKHFMGLFYFY